MLKAMFLDKTINQVCSRALLSKLICMLIYKKITLMIKATKPKDASKNKSFKKKIRTNNFGPYSFVS